MEWCVEGVWELAAEAVRYVRDGEVYISAAATCVLLLFLWYCYRMGRDQSPSNLRRRYLTAPGRMGGFMSPDCRGRGGGKRALGLDEQNGFAFCQSPECFRCTSAGESLNQRLYHSLQEYAKRYTWSGMGRVHKGVRDQGRYLNSRRSIQRPEVFFLPDLPSAPFFSREVQRHDVELLEQSFPTLLAEFENIYQAAGPGGSAPPPGWKANATPRGQWWTFYLVNQGIPLVPNVRRCPRAWRVLAQLRTFIANNVFGNACFSVLTPGGLISEHYGPTNIRLRCHLGKNQAGLGGFCSPLSSAWTVFGPSRSRVLLTGSIKPAAWPQDLDLPLSVTAGFCLPGLRVPPSCELVVGGEPQCWSEGSCLLFDDSFLHRAFHEGETLSRDRHFKLVSLQKKQKNFGVSQGKHCIS